MIPSARKFVLFALVLLSAVNQLDNKLPVYEQNLSKLTGSGLSSLTILLSLFFRSWALGGLGALMSVPLTLMVKLLFFDAFESTRVISEIMATPVRAVAKRRRRREGSATVAGDRSRLTQAWSRAG